MNIETATLIVLSFTMFAIVWQAWATADAAKATRDALQATERHFELLNAQWIDVSEFYCEPGAVTDSASGAVSDMWWSVEFRITNNSPLKVTVQTIEFYLDGDITTGLLRKTCGPTILGDQAHRRCR